jgi:hypothetical protein
MSLSGEVSSGVSPGSFISLTPITNKEGSKYIEVDFTTPLRDIIKPPSPFTHEQSVKEVETTEVNSSKGCLCARHNLLYHMAHVLGHWSV